MLNYHSSLPAAFFPSTQITCPSVSSSLQLFKIVIKNGNKTLSIEKSNPKSKDILFKEKIGSSENLLTRDSIKKKYRLIYDIPEDPTRRINSLLNEVKTLQLEIGNKTSAFRNYLLSIISEIRSSRDPKQIAKLEKDIKSLESSLKTSTKSLEEKQKLVNELEKMTF